MNKYAFTAWIFFIFCSPVLAVQLPPDFSAQYTLEKYDMVIAEMKLSLHTDNGTLIYRSDTEPKGLAAILSDQEIHETSRLSQTDSTTLPDLLSYQYRHHKRPEKHQQFTIDRSKQDVLNISGRYGDKDYDIQAHQPVWDRLSVQLALAGEASSTEKMPEQFSYNVIDRGEISQYRFEYMGQSELEVGDRHYTTLRFKRSHGKRTTFVWLAKDLHYIPVKIEQHRKGELHLRMTLDSIKL